MTATAASIAKELREGLANVTPGPWIPEPHAGRGAWVQGSDGNWVALACGGDDGLGKAHAAHIARCSPDRIATLIEAFEAMAEALTEAEKLHKIGLLNAPDDLYDRVRELRKAALGKAGL